MSHQSLSSETGAFACVFYLNQAAFKEGDDASAGSGNAERLPLLTDLVLYYCRYADQPVLVQLYQAEVTHQHTCADTHKQTAHA